MLRVSALTKSYGGDVVLRDVSFVLPSGRRAGLVGPNGSGKSTLLRLIAGQIEPDAGSIWTDPADYVAYLPQYPADELHLTVRESLLRGAGRVGELEQQLAQQEQSLQHLSGEALDGALAQYAETRDEFERLGGYELQSRMESVVDGLSLDALGMESPVASLSGGNKTKLSLARLLLSGATIRLLDEPTNYLDLSAILWLERFVVESTATYLIVSHDRRFLDRTVDSILELDAEEHTLRSWFGTYSAYAEAKRIEEEKYMQAYLDQQTEIARIEEDIRRTREQARSTEARTKSGLGADHARRLAKKVARKAKTRERKLERELEENAMEKPRRSWSLHLADLGRNPIEDTRMVLEIRNLHAGYEGHEVLHGVDLTVRGRDRLALLGSNGSGKSTLLRCITGQISHEGTVRLGPSVRLGVLSQENEDLPLDVTVLDAFRARTEMHESEARAYLHRFLFKGADALKSVRSLSYGQRSKLALAILILSNANFLVLDEPTSHMDMPALGAIEEALAAYVGPLLVVSHDRTFVEALNVNRVEVMEEGCLHAVESVEAYEEAMRRMERISA